MARSLRALLRRAGARAVLVSPYGGELPRAAAALADRVLGPGTVPRSWWAATTPSTAQAMVDGVLFVVETNPTSAGAGTGRRRRLVLWAHLWCPADDHDWVPMDLWVQLATTTPTIRAGAGHCARVRALLRALTDPRRCWCPDAGPLARGEPDLAPAALAVPGLAVEGGGR